MRSSWLISGSATLLVGALAVGTGIALGPGCEFGCFNNFDCPDQTFCGEGGVCMSECATASDCVVQPSACEGPPECCSAAVVCSSFGRCTWPKLLTDACADTPDSDGWDAPPGAGVSFIVNQIAIAGKERGFDIDGECDSSGCIDNFLWRLGELGNDQIRQGLLGGESLLLFEVAGLKPWYREDDDAVTVKIYGGRDADDPFFPANNFKVPPGHTSCCEFKVTPESVVGTTQARTRLPARISGGHLRSLAPAPVTITLTGTSSADDIHMRMERAVISGRLPSNLKYFNAGLLGGAVPLVQLAFLKNAYCEIVGPHCPVSLGDDSTLVDLVTSRLGPRADIDLDGDGYECLLDTDGDGSVDRCCDGILGEQCLAPDGTCLGEEVQSPETAAWRCALDPRIADGFSVGITFTGVRATIVGLGR